MYFNAKDARISNEHKQTVCNSLQQKDVWNDREEAKDYFLEAMMSTDGEEHERAECVYIQIMNGLDYCSDENDDD